MASLPVGGGAGGGHPAVPGRRADRGAAGVGVLPAPEVRATQQDARRRGRDGVRGARRRNGRAAAAAWRRQRSPVHRGAADLSHGDRRRRLGDPVSRPRSCATVAG